MDATFERVDVEMRRRLGSGRIRRLPYVRSPSGRRHRRSRSGQSADGRGTQYRSSARAIRTSSSGCRTLRSRSRSIASVDFVIHMASPASPQGLSDVSDRDAGCGLAGNQAECWNWPRERREVSVTSTSETYGDPAVHPQVETYWGNVNPVGPRSCYDESKRFAEALTMAYHRHSRREDQHRAHLQYLRAADEVE